MDITTVFLVILGLLAGAGLGWYAAAGRAASASTDADRSLREELAGTRSRQAQLEATLHAERAA
ncbi:MAG: hypothetical protein QOC55_2619, partial [Thermoleophilaceae bacterium]|nr:hypothetical protein [Thermoleophilaceae bacterium]